MTTSGGVRAVEALTTLPGVAEAVDRARAACAALRWHPGLRNRVPEAAAESRVRGAAASGELEGARLSVDVVRDLMRGAVAWHTPPDPVERVMQGAVAATAETEVVCRSVLTAPRQALARLHVLAASGLLEPQALGRPRTGDEGCDELADVGPVPPARQLPERLAALAELLLGAPDLPGPLVAAIVHAEVACARPFRRGNAVVARAMERAVLQATGVDPTGVAVPEWGYRSLGGPAYLGALAAYASGGGVGVGLWVEHAGAAVASGAAEGARIADAVLAGRLTSPS